MSKTEPKSWRDVITIHPAADLFPLMTPDELTALGEDIRQHGYAVADRVVDRTRGRRRKDAAAAILSARRAQPARRDGDASGSR